MKYFNQAQSFVQWIVSLVPKKSNDPRSDEHYVLWFMCLSECGMFDDMTSNDLAEVLFNGVTPKKNDPIAHLQDWLQYGIYQNYEDMEEAGYKDGDDISKEDMIKYEVTDVFDLMQVSRFISDEEYQQLRKQNQ